MSTGRAQACSRGQVEGLHIRWMIRRDMPAVMRTERASFEHSWTEDDFLRCLRQRNCIGMVAEVDETITGFMVYELQRRHLHLLNFAVHPEHRRHGIGRQMVAKLVDKMITHQREKIVLAVRERNLVAQMFFRSQGFQATRLLRGYYRDSGEDAYQMEYAAPATASLDKPRVLAPVNRIRGYEDC